MFDVGWSELLVIAVIAVVLIGPKDIPKIMYTLGRVMRRFQYAKFALTQQFDDILKAGDIEELRRGVNFETKGKENASAVADEKNADEEEAFVKPDIKDDAPEVETIPPSSRKTGDE